ncbi:hypothetical protein DBR42_16910, partial [Pelomonas sp. HMWF004]
RNAVGEADSRALQRQPSISVSTPGCRYSVLPRATSTEPEAEPGSLSHVGFTWLGSNASPVAGAAYAVVHRAGTLSLTPAELPNQPRLTAPGKLLSSYSFSLAGTQGITVSINAHIAESGLVIQSSGTDAAALVRTESQLIAAAAILEASRQGLMPPAKVRTIYFDATR